MMVHLRTLPRRAMMAVMVVIEVDMVVSVPMVGAGCDRVDHPRRGF